jgi:hypothetical protein
MSPPEHSLHLAESAVARLCHDLSGSLSAVMSALEYVTAGRTTPSFDALELAVEATRELTARLRLARMLWVCDHPMALPELIQLADGLPGRGRLRLDVTMAGAPDCTMQPNAARLLLAALSMAAESVRGPGMVSLAGEVGREAVIVIEGARAAWPADLPTLMANPAAAWTTTNVRDLMPQLTVLLAAHSGATLSMMLPTSPSSTPPPLLVRLA